MPATDDEIREKYLERAIRELNRFTRDLQACDSCTRGNLLPVLGSGHPQADIFLLKHAALPSEVEEGVAFYGRAGTALMKSLKRLDIDPLQVYGTLCVKCPVGDPAVAAPECISRIVEELAIVQPKIVVVMGEDALAALNDLQLPLATTVRADPGAIQKLTPSIDALFTPNIDASLDEEDAKRAFWRAFRVLGDWYADFPAVLMLGGALCVIPSAVVTQAIAAAGAGFVLIDREHGPIGRESLHAMIAATAGTSCEPWVRVGGILEDEVKLALDCGATAVVFPMVRTREDAERCVELVRYPPAGRRGWGPFAAHARHGVALGDYLSQVRVKCGLLIETVEAVEAIEEILAVDGVDFAIYAQYDLSTAMGLHGRFDHPELLAARGRIERAAGGVRLGCAALTPEATRDAIARGYEILIHGFDTIMLGGQVAAWPDWRRPPGAPSVG